MNVSELARRLRVNPNKLREVLPEFGYDIGAKAIKIDDRVANQIMRDWRRIKQELEDRVSKEQQRKKEEEKAARQESGAEVALPEVLTVKEFAELLQLPLTRVIVELMKNGVLASQNERIDRDSATIIAQELGFTVSAPEATPSVSGGRHEETLAEVLSSDKDAAPRAPVVVVMGHVDHGKTRLLDAIRKTHVMEGETGGITQHIGAYTVNWRSKDGSARNITFIDTPGHEAFTVMRSRGAKVADVAILVVAADDGVKPQTLEVISIIKAAKLPFIVAINKIDKEDANPDKVRTELSQRGVQPEEWGGTVPMVEISARENINIDKLLDVVLLVADLNAQHLRANPDRPAAGTIIESHVDRGEGAVATVLVQTGTLHAGDPLVVNGEIYGKVRAMKDFQGAEVKHAPPSMPVKILGFKVEPDVGDILNVGAAADASAIDARQKRVARKGAQKVTAREKKEGDEQENVMVLKVIVRADVLGSLEALLSELEKLSFDEAAVKVVGKGLGNITDDDVRTAAALEAHLLGFRVGLTPVAEQMVREEHREFNRFDIIYDLLNFVKALMEQMLGEEEVKREVARGKVIRVFRTDKNRQTLGVLVENGTITPNLRVEAVRDGKRVGEGVMKSLQLGRDAAREVHAGSQCGLGFESLENAKDGDELLFFTMERKKKQLTSSV